MIPGTVGRTFTSIQKTRQAAENGVSGWHLRTTASIPFIELPWKPNQLVIGGTTWPSLHQAIEWLSRTVRELATRHWRIYCLASRPDSELLWAHYAEKHQGVCLEFDAQTEHFGGACRVQYLDNRPLIGPEDFNDPQDLTASVLLAKSQAWAYEGEYRIVARDQNTDPTFAVRTEKDFLQVHSGALVGIIVGCRADLKGIQAAMAESGRDVPIRRAEPMKDRYQFDLIG